MKKLITCLLALCMLSGCAVKDFLAKIFDFEGKIIQKVSDRTELGKGYTVKDGVLNIYRNLDYDLVDNEIWWDEVDDIEAVIVTEGVTSLPESMLMSCYNLHSVALPESLEKIGSFAFAYCDNLKEVKLPGRLKEIGFEAFAHSAIEKLEIPASVQTIEWGIVEGCDKLQSITVDKNSCYYSSADCNIICDHEEKVLIATCNTSRIPEGIVAIDSFTHNGLSMKEIIFPGTLKWISSFSFQNSGLEHLVIPASVEFIGDECFAECYNLKTVEFEYSEKPICICENVFEHCKMLESVEYNGRLTVSEDEYYSNPDVFNLYNSDIYAFYYE